jgi:hypothetical protein
LAEEAGGWATLAPSSIPFGGELTKVPRAMSVADIQRVQGDFVAATKRALAIGYQWLEVHSAHGYLSHEFLSPISNQRTDQYGPPIAQRMIIQGTGITIPDGRAPRIRHPERSEGSQNAKVSHFEILRRLRASG